MSYFANFGSKLLNTVLDTVDHVLENDEDEEEEGNNNRNHHKTGGDKSADDQYDDNNNDDESEKGDNDCEDQNGYQSNDIIEPSTQSYNGSLDEIDLNSTTNTTSYSVESKPIATGSASSFFDAPVFNNQFFNLANNGVNNNNSINNSNYNNESAIISAEKSINSDSMFAIMKADNGDYVEQNNHIVASSTSVLETSGLQDVSFDDDKDDNENDENEELDDSNTSKKLFSDSPDHQSYDNQNQIQYSNQQQTSHQLSSQATLLSNQSSSNIHQHSSYQKQLSESLSSNSTLLKPTTNNNSSNDDDHDKLKMIQLIKQQQIEMDDLKQQLSTEISASNSKLTDMILSEQDVFKQKLEEKESEVLILTQQLTQANASINQYKQTINKIKQSTTDEVQQWQQRYQQLEQQIQQIQSEQSNQKSSEQNHHAELLQQQHVLQFEQQQKEQSLQLQQLQQQYESILLEYEDRLKLAEDITRQAKAEQSECDEKKITALLEKEEVLKGKEAVVKKQVEELTDELNQAQVQLTNVAASTVDNIIDTTVNRDSTTSNIIEISTNTITNTAASDIISIQQQHQQIIQQKEKEQQQLELKITKYKAAIKEVSHKLQQVLLLHKQQQQQEQQQHNIKYIGNNNDNYNTISNDNSTIAEVVLVDNNTTGTASLNILRHQIESIDKALTASLNVNNELSAALEYIDTTLSSLLTSTNNTNNSNILIQDAANDNANDNSSNMNGHNHPQQQQQSVLPPLPVIHSQWLRELVERVQSSVTDYMQKSEQAGEEMNIKYNDLSTQHSVTVTEMSLLQSQLQQVQQQLEDCQLQLLTSQQPIEAITSSNNISHETSNDSNNNNNTALIESLNQQLSQLQQQYQQQSESIEKSHTDKIQNLTTAMNELTQNKSMIETQYNAQLAVVEKLSIEKKAVENTFREQQEKVTQLMQSVQSREMMEKEYRERKEQSETMAIQMNGFKQQAIKLETENKQLHQVISQLRQVRKVGKEDVDAVNNERDEVKMKNVTLQTELTRLQSALSSSAQDLESFSQLQHELQTNTAYILTLEKSHDSLKNEYSQLQQNHSERNKDISILRSDILLLQQDLQQRNIECHNLKIALENVSKNHTIECKRLQELYSHQIQTKEKEWLIKIQEIEIDWQNKIDTQMIVTTQLEQKVSDEALLRRKFEIDMNTEKRRMAKTLESALSQLQNSKDDVVDRALIANLIVNYFLRKRSTDILELIAKILTFTDEQKEIIGLKPPSLSQSIISSLLTTVVGQPQSTATPENVEGDNLAELWVNFLLLESGENSNSDSNNHQHNTSSSSHSTGGSFNANNSGSGRNRASSNANNSTANNTTVVSSDGHVGHLRHTQRQPLSPREIIEMSRQHSQQHSSINNNNNNNSNNASTSTTQQSSHMFSFSNK